LTGRSTAPTSPCLAGNFGTTGKDWTAGDFDGSGAINGTDFALLAGNFGGSLPGAAAVDAADWAALESFGNGIGVNVPEPVALPVVVLGVGLLLRRRQRREREAR
jgi:hypothetical protein